MSKWPCCQKERGPVVSCSRETAIIDGEEYDLIPFGDGDRGLTYEERIERKQEEIENGGRGKFTAEYAKRELEQFKKNNSKVEYNNRACHDCGTPFGEVHHLGCDMEECPKCGGQYFICDCHSIEKEELWA